MSILLEGCDRCFKSSLGVILRDALPGWSYSYHTKPPAGVSVYSYHFRSLADSHARQVIDRMHLSEMVYGSVYGPDGLNVRGPAGYTNHEWRMIQLALMSRNTTVIVMHDDPDAVAARWTKSEMFPVEGVPQLIAAYREIATNEAINRLPTWYCTRDELIDVAGGSMKSDLVEILNEARHGANTAPWLSPSLGTGSTRPKVLFVGEAPGKPIASGHTPAQQPLDFGFAAEEFWAALDEARFKWWLGYYTNQSAFANENVLIDFVQRACPEIIVTLGNVAWKFVQGALRSYGSQMPPVVCVLHPSFVRRFNFSSDQRGAWRAKIKKHIAAWCEGEPKCQSSESDTSLELAASR